MSNGGNLPDVPDSWDKALTKIKEIVVIVGTIAAAVAATTASIVSGCNNSKIAQVQAHQEANSVKLDEVKDHAVKAAEKASDADKKAEGLGKTLDETKSKVDKLPMR